ncbi:MAG TPA: Gfo/Idh/MocA family oxidoreductase [Novosphingobium sp.]|nr:Gfo/Idh/MocA family oxidoreductase [Novosphingobium sp.]
MPLRVGVLGTARVATYALIDPARPLPELTVEMIGSRDGDRARDYAQRHGIARWGSYDDLLSDPALDAIYVALPVSLHAQWSLRALASGKAVLCEKPLARNAGEAAKCLSEARGFQETFAEALHWSCHPVADRLRQIVANGPLGEIRSVETRFIIPKSYLLEDDFRLDYQRGGGVLLDAGYYCISLLRMMLGEPLGVRQASATLVAPQVDGEIDARLEFAAGATGRIVASNQFAGDMLEITARILADGGSARVVNPFMPHLGCRIEFEQAGRRWNENIDSRSSYAFQAEQFVCRARRGDRSLASIEDAVANLVAIDAIYHAAGLPPRGQAYP